MEKQRRKRYVKSPGPNQIQIPKTIIETVVTRANPFLPFQTRCTNKK